MLLPGSAVREGRGRARGAPGEMACSLDDGRRPRRTRARLLARDVFGGRRRVGSVTLLAAELSGWHAAESAEQAERLTERGRDRAPRRRAPGDRGRRFTLSRRGSLHADESGARPIAAAPFRRARAAHAGPPRRYRVVEVDDAVVALVLRPCAVSESAHVVWSARPAVDGWRLAMIWALDNGSRTASVGRGLRPGERGRRLAAVLRCGGDDAQFL